MALPSRVVAIAQGDRAGYAGLAFTAALLALRVGLSAADPVVTLWPDGAPGSQRTPTTLSVTERGNPQILSDRYATGITEPTLRVFRAPEPNGRALLVIPGGGYRRVVMDKEGYETAAWFSARGVSAFVLAYRLPGETWSAGPDVSLQDAQRALRWIRGRAASFGIDAARIGVIGFSAGGHLAGSLATGFDRQVYAPVDAIDDESARPDFAVLLYPVVSMRAEIAHAGSREHLIGPEPDDRTVARYSVENRVSPDTPPMFLLHAVDDSSVLVDHSLELFGALRRAGVRADLHLFATGGHGFGLRYALDQPVAEWPALVQRWLEQLD